MDFRNPLPTLQFYKRFLLRYNPDPIEILHRMKLIITRKICFEPAPNEDSLIYIEGSARSGTTWLAEVIARYYRYRIIFEPFNYRQFPVPTYYEFLYQHPEVSNKKLANFVDFVLQKPFRHIWTDSTNQILNPKGRIVKSIRSSLFLKWLRNLHPKFPIVYIIRHPCAVVSSRMNFDWDFDIKQHFLGQSRLVDEYIEPYKKIIEEADTPVKRAACLWCIQNLIPILTMERNDWLVTSYEELVLNFEKEMKRIINYISPNSEFQEKNLKNKISLSSNSKTFLIQKQNPLKIWESRLTEEEINDIMNIVAEFSMNKYYTRNVIPTKELYELSL